MGRLIDESLLQEKLALIPMEERTFRRTVQELENAPTVKAIPLDKVEQIRNEIEQEYNKFRNMSDKWDERACGLGTALEIINRAIKEQN